MTAELFPKGDKVEVILDDAETTSVPDGKAWVVNVHSSTDGGFKFYNDEVGLVQHLEGDSEEIDSSSKTTIHEGGEIRSGGDGGVITGWQFEYGGE